ncbi:MAG: hypothetical protein ACAI44_19405 [Candidatus Sericytochromatia bacterium]
MTPGTISATICTPGGAAFQLVLIPANSLAQAIVLEEKEKVLEAAARGETYAIDLADLVPGFFAQMGPESKDPEYFRALLTDVSADTLLHDAARVLIQFEQGTSVIPESDRQLLSAWLRQLGKLPLDERQQRQLDDVLVLAAKHGVEAP